MHVDLDDIPEHLKSRKKGKGLHFLGTMAVGTAVIGVLAAVASINVPVTRHPQIAVVTEPQVGGGSRNTTSADWSGYKGDTGQNQKATYEAEETPEDTQPQTEPEPVRQTVFNDQNYTPRGADNVLAFEEVKPEAKPIQTTRKPKEIVVVGVQRDLANEVCSYGNKEGSVEKRNCKARFNLNTRNQ